MTRDDDFIQQLEGYLDEYEGTTPLPDAVRHAVRAQLSTTTQIGPVSGLMRDLTMNKLVAVGLAAAAAIVLAFIGIQLVGGPNLAEPGPTESPIPTLGPSTPETPQPVASDAALPLSGSLAPGTYIVADPFPVEVRLALGDRWTMWSTGVGADGVGLYRLSLNPPFGAGLVIAVVDNLYADACVPVQGLEPAVGPSTQDLAAAFTAQSSTTTTTAPTDVTVDGYSGTFVAYRMNASDCQSIARWPTSQGPREGIPGEIDQVWILDVDGTRVVVDLFSFDTTRPEDLAEVQLVVDSLDFQPAD